MFGLLDLGLFGIAMLIILFIVLLPVIITLLVGMALASTIGLVGVSYWIFVIIFYLVLAAILGYIAK